MSKERLWQKSTFFALVRGELAIDNGGFEPARRLADLPAWPRKTPALDLLRAPERGRWRQGFPALGPGSPGPRADDNGLLVAELRQKLDTMVPTAFAPRRRAAAVWVFGGDQLDSAGQKLLRRLAYA